MIRNDIKCLQNNILNAIMVKKRSIRRKWMELNSLTNAHLLILLPYQAQLTHVSQLVEARRNLLSEIEEQNYIHRQQDVDNSEKSELIRNVSNDGEDSISNFPTTDIQGQTR